MTDSSLAPTVLAIDQGTTSTKAFVLKPDGTFSSIARRVHRQFMPRDGHVEHDAEELICHIEQLIDHALEIEPAITAVALANQGETVVAWDSKTGRPLYNAIVWQDQRSQPMLDAMRADAAARIRRRSGLPLDAYFSASKMAWLLRHAPDVREAARLGRLRIGTSESFFIDRLCGTYLTDPTTASRTSLMDLEACRFDEELCGLFEIPSDLLPCIVPTGGSFGTIRRGGHELPLVVSVVDQQAALFGHGCRNDGDAKVTFGTGSFALALTANRPTIDDPGLIPTIAWQFGADEPRYALDAGDYTAAAAVDWAIESGIAESIDDFEFVDDVPAVTKGLVFVPALAGLAAPHWKRNVTGAFIGLRQSTDAADLRKAVIEGVAFRGVDLIDTICGTGSGLVSVDGGLACNAYFVQFLADAANRPILLQERPELTALGLAEMAFHTLGHPAPLRKGSIPRIVNPGPHASAIRKARPFFQSAVASLIALAPQEAAFHEDRP